MNPLKSLLYSSLVLIALLAVVSCACENPIGPDNGTNPTNTGINNPSNGSIPIERPLYIVSSPENSITRTVSIDTNILDLYLSSGYNPDDFSVTHLDGVDAGIINRDSLDINLEDKSIIGTIALRQRLDFENPTDGGENAGDNDYEVALFRVMNATSSNDFKLIVRITDAPDPKKLEILIDSFHLDNINEMRGIREIYLYENSRVLDPLMGDDSNNFLSASLIRGIEPIGDRMAFPLANLYDNNDSGSAFVTATTVNSNSNTYHRLNIDFTEEVYIEKVAIRGRQIGGYYGFVFILRDKNDHIIAVHQASNPLSRGSGSDGNSTSTYAFVPDYEDSRFPITNFDIELDNMYFDIAENSTNVILVDNFFVAPGYEYERGIVSIDPGADIDKFNTNNLYFLDNELVGLSFKTAPDAEDEQDADSNNVYEVGTITITNIDGGRLAFDLPVRVVNVPSTVSLYSNTVSYNVGIFTSNVIDDLTALVHPSNFNNINLGNGVFIYELTGDDASYFRTVGNSLKPANDLTFINNISKIIYDFRIAYQTESGDAAVLDVTVNVFGEGFFQMSRIAPWRARKGFQAVVLTNNDVLLMGGIDDENNRLNDVWLSSDSGLSWEQVTAAAEWFPRDGFQAVVLKNNDILVIGGRCDLIYGGDRGDAWISSSGGTNWHPLFLSTADDYYVDWRGYDVDYVPFQYGIPGNGRSYFQALMLTNDDIYITPGIVDSVFVRYDNQIVGSSPHLNSIETDPSPTVILDNNISFNGGTNWSKVSVSQDPRTTHPLSGGNFAPYGRGSQAVVLTNNNMLFLQGSEYWIYGGRFSRIMHSRNTGNSWYIKHPIAPFGYRSFFQAEVVDNNEVVVMGGYDGAGPTSLNDFWLSTDEGSTWSDVTPTNVGDWRRHSFQTVTLENERGETYILFFGGAETKGGEMEFYNDTWFWKR